MSVPPACASNVGEVSSVGNWLAGEAGVASKRHFVRIWPATAHVAFIHSTAEPAHTEKPLPADGFVCVVGFMCGH
jgi:hypothetical protein